MLVLNEKGSTLLFSNFDSLHGKWLQIGKSILQILCNLKCIQIM